MNLGEVVKLLASSGQSGLLHLMGMGPDQTGGCYFQLGRLVHASLGNYHGLDAISRMSRMVDGAFAFEEGVASPEQSLGGYPTEALVEMIGEHMAEYDALRAATPDADDVPIYLTGRKLDGLQASPDELSILLLCNGVRSVREISQQTNQNPADVRTALAKFRQAGVIDVQRLHSVDPATPTPPPPPAPDPAPQITEPEAHSPEAGQTPTPGDGVRYWRGRRIN